MHGYIHVIVAVCLINSLVRHEHWGYNGFMFQVFCLVLEIIDPLISDERVGAMAIRILIWYGF